MSIQIASAATETTTSNRVSDFIFALPWVRSQVLHEVAFGIREDHVTHGWRKTASTLLNQSNQWNPDAIERAIAHKDTSVRGIYNIGAYWDERVRMAQWWADYLDMLRTGAEIVPFRKGA